MYVRNYGEGLDLQWENVFQTSNKSEVETYCRNAGIEFEWRAQIISEPVKSVKLSPLIRKPVRRCGLTKLICFMSSLHPKVRESLLSMIKESDLRNAFYGDGSNIEPSVLDEIRKFISRKP